MPSATFFLTVGKNPSRVNDPGSLYGLRHCGDAYDIWQFLFENAK
jgi:hypothetical protein